MIPPIIFGALTLLTAGIVLSTRHACLRALTFCFLLIACVGLWQASLGQPRDAIFKSPTGVVVGFMPDEPHAIYLWVLPDHGNVPVAYKLPWSEKQAANLQNAAIEAMQNRGQLHVGGQVKDGQKGEHHPGDLKFYSEKPNPLPPKVPR